MPSAYGLPTFSAPTYPGGLEPYVPMPVHLDLSNLLKYSALQSKADGKTKGSEDKKDKAIDLDALSGEGRRIEEQAQRGLKLMTSTLGKYSENKELALNDPDYIKGNNLYNDAYSPANLNEAKRTKELVTLIRTKQADEKTGDQFSYAAFDGAYDPSLRGRFTTNGKLLEYAETEPFARAFVNEGTLTEEVITPVKMEGMFQDMLKKAGKTLTSAERNKYGRLIASALIAPSSSESVRVGEIDGIPGVISETYSSAARNPMSNEPGLMEIGTQLMGSAGNLMRNVYFTEFVNSTQGKKYTDDKNDKPWKRGEAGSYLDKDGNATVDFRADFGQFIAKKVEGMINGLKDEDPGITGTDGYSIQFKPLEAYAADKYNAKQELLSAYMNGTPTITTTNEHIENPLDKDGNFVPTSNLLQMMVASPNPTTQTIAQLMLQPADAGNEDGKTTKYNGGTTFSELLSPLGSADARGDFHVSWMPGVTHHNATDGYNQENADRRKDIVKELNSYGLDETATVAQYLAKVHENNDYNKMLGMKDLTRTVNFNTMPTVMGGFVSALSTLRKASGGVGGFNDNGKVEVADWIGSNDYALTNTGDFINVSDKNGFGGAEIVELESEGQMEVPNTGFTFERVGEGENMRLVPKRIGNGNNYNKSDGVSDLVELGPDGTLVATPYAIEAYVRSYNEGDYNMDPMVQNQRRAQAKRDIVLSVQNNPSLLPKQHTFGVTVAIPVNKGKDGFNFMVSTPNVKKIQSKDNLALWQLDALEKQGATKDDIRIKNITGGLSAEEFRKKNMVPVSATVPGMREQVPAWDSKTGKPNELLGATIQTGKDGQQYYILKGVNLSTGNMMKMDPDLSHFARKAEVKAVGRTAREQSSDAQVGANSRRK